MPFFVKYYRDNPGLVPPLTEWLEELPAKAQIKRATTCADPQHTTCGTGSMSSGSGCKESTIESSIFSMAARSWLSRTD
jgi:hypothetical protein